MLFQYLTTADVMDEVINCFGQVLEAEAMRWGNPDRLDRWSWIELFVPGQDPNGPYSDPRGVEKYRRNIAYPYLFPQYYHVASSRRWFLLAAAVGGLYSGNPDDENKSPHEVHLPPVPGPGCQPRCHHRL